MEHTGVPGAKDSIEILKEENETLLDELEAIYRQVEEHLSASRHEREIAYQELRDKNRELQHRLEDLERTNRELQETQRMLIRSERLAAMGEMAAAIVHEIKNPLTVIIGRAQLMAMSEVPDPEDLESLLKSGEYLRNLVENVLGFARHHRGKPCDLDLNDLVTRLLSFVRPIVRDTEIRAEISPGALQVRADPGQIEQVLMNLVLNALDAVGKQGRLEIATGAGSICEATKRSISLNRPFRLAIEMPEDSLASGYACVVVSDDGPGIREAHMGRLFEAFFTTKGEEKGTGLGLSIARTILAEWGGNILVSSSVGHGASFTLFLPLARQGQTAP